MITLDLYSLHGHAWAGLVPWLPTFRIDPKQRADPFGSSRLRFVSQTRAPNNVAFKVAGVRDSKSNAIAGDIEGKFVDPKNGVTFTQTWTTSNVLRTQIELENQIAKGALHLC